MLLQKKWCAIAERETFNRSDVFDEDLADPCVDYAVAHLIEDVRNLIESLRNEKEFAVQLRTA